MSTVENQELQTRKVAIGATSVGAPTSIDLEARTYGCCKGVMSMYNGEAALAVFPVRMGGFSC